MRTWPGVKVVFLRNHSRQALRGSRGYRLRSATRVALLRAPAAQAIPVRRVAWTPCMAVARTCAMRRKRVLGALGALVASLVVLELLLQVLALGVWWVSPPVRVGRSGAGETVVLCVGDSFTQGVGAVRDA